MNRPFSRPAIWKVWVRLPAVTTNPATPGSGSLCADSLIHFQTPVVTVPPPTTRSVGVVKPMFHRLLAVIHSPPAVGFRGPKALP